MRKLTLLFSAGAVLLIVLPLSLTRSLQSQQVDAASDSAAATDDSAGAVQMKELLERHHEAELRAQQLAAQYRRLRGGKEIDTQRATELRDQLYSALEEAWTARQDFQRAQAAQMKQRLAEVERRLAQRESQKEAIVTQRLAELLEGRSAAPEVVPPATFQPQTSPNVPVPATTTPTLTAEAAPATATVKMPVARTVVENGRPKMVYEIVELAPDRIGDRVGDSQSPLGKSPTALQQNLMAAKVASAQADQALTDAQAAAKRAEEQLKQAQEHYRKGLDTMEAVFIAEARLDEAQAKLREAAMRRDQAPQMLKLAQQELETTKRLLALDVRAAEARLQVARNELQKSEDIHKRTAGAISPYELDRLRLLAQEAEVAVERAQTLLHVFKLVDDEEIDNEAPGVRR